MSRMNSLAVSSNPGRMAGAVPSDDAGWDAGGLWLHALACSAVALVLLCAGCSTPSGSGSDVPVSDKPDAKDATVIGDTARTPDSGPVDTKLPDGRTPDGVPLDVHGDKGAPETVGAESAVQGPLDECPEQCVDPKFTCVNPADSQSPPFLSACTVTCKPEFLGADCLSAGDGKTCCGPALDAAGEQGFYCLPPEGCCTECGALCCPDATHQCVDDGADCIPQGYTYCGNGASCPPGDVCKPDGECCPASSPVPCGINCCAADETCIADDASCIPQGAVYCGGGKYCDMGYKCTEGGGCCPELKPISCGEQCCALGTECAPECQVCLLPGEELCADCSICPPGQSCQFGGGCMPDGADDCSDGTFCPPNMVCVTGGSVPCCPTNKPQVCGDDCCFAEYNCIHSDNLCICPDCEHCGDGHWCKVGWECTSVCADENDPNGCCMPMGSVDCQDGSYCPPGNVCVGFDKKCCPGATPQLCGDQCCPLDYKCVNDGEACICSGCSYCGNGLICPPGTECLDTGPGCMPMGSKDCGGGKFCPPGKVCAKGAPDGCCPADAPMACGTQCCPDTYECFPECNKCVPPGWTKCAGCNMCKPGTECINGTDKCMPLGGEDCGDGTYCNIGFVCAPGLQIAVANDPGPGCLSSTKPGCQGCFCEACVCALDSFCCDVKWDSVCAMMCQASCGATCQEICTPSCTSKQCGDDGCGGTCGSCAPGQICQEGKCIFTDSGCAETLMPGCNGCDCESCVCQMMPECCMAFGWWGGGWTGKCVEQCKKCGGCSSCQPDCAGRTCGPDGCGGSCGTCDGAICNLQEGKCVPCVASCTGKECGSDGCGGSCGKCDPGSTCNEGVCEDAPQGTGRCCPSVAPKGCNKICCPSGDTCIPTDKDGLCLPPGAEYCGDSLVCLSGDTCMKSCKKCMPDGSEDCGNCFSCLPGSVCAAGGTMCCPADKPVGCGSKCCTTAEGCYAKGGWSGTGMCTPPGADVCKLQKTYCPQGQMCLDSCFDLNPNYSGNPCRTTGTQDCGECHSCSPGKKCCGSADLCCAGTDTCYFTGGSSGQGLCVPQGATTCKSAKYYCTAGNSCMTSCDSCMPTGSCDNGGCGWCGPDKVCVGGGKCCPKTAPKHCNTKCCNSSDTCYPQGGDGSGMCVPPGGVYCGTFWCSKGNACMTSCSGCMPSGSQDCGGCTYCKAGYHCVGGGKCAPN